MGPIFKESVPMRHPVVLCSFAAGLIAAPLAAQANQKISILTGDTTVVIERGARSSCRVEIDGRALPTRDAEKICESKQHNISWNSPDGSMLRLRLDSLGNSMRFMMGDSMLALEGLARSQADMARELATRSRALNLDGQMLALKNLQSGRSGLNVFGAFDSLLAPRPVIGITVETRARDTDRYGAYVAAVTPSGPADKAGLRSGDLITRIADRSLNSGATKRAVSADESRPYVRLIEVMATLEAGKEVALEYRRGDANRTTKVTPRDDDQVFAFGSTWSTENEPEGVLYRVAPTPSNAPTAWSFGDSRPPVATMVPRATAPRTAVFASYGFGSVLGSTELTSMNQRLGRYFGTSEGVLVVNTDEKNSLGLQPGDVVQSIDGRSIQNPNELGRVLRSYESGDRISIGLFRDKKSQTVSARLP